MAQEELATASVVANAANERLSAAQRQAEALGQIVSGLRALRQAEAEPQKEQLPVAENEPAVYLKLTPSGDPPPRGRDAIRQVMRASGRTWSNAELIAELQRRNWVDANAKQPEAAIRVAARRLADDGELEKVAPGVYRYKDSSASALDDAARLISEPEALVAREEV
ncbi:MAG TPA: hypothetical protein VNI55_05285 [Gaiellaceae bacterium]|nr:hypothetical protein [Gaiellaceae bacterium]